MRSLVAAALLALVGANAAHSFGLPGTRTARAAGGRTRVRLRLVPAPDGNEVRFKVKEQLAVLTLPNTAVGTTSRITGAIVLQDGRVVPAESKFSVALDSLKSDRDRRDGYIKRRTLETARFPTADLSITDLPGLSWPLPASGPMTFQIVGDLTVHGVTHPVTWQVTAEARDGGYIGLATTRVKFEDFGMEQPRVAIVLSVEDDIGLEYQFHLVPAQQ